jgi:hypothetical protein
MGRSAVAPPRRTDQAERAFPEIKPASGIVNEPMIGTKTVSRVIVSMFIVGGLIYFFGTPHVKALFTGYSGVILSIFTGIFTPKKLGNRRLAGVGLFMAFPGRFSRGPRNSVRPSLSPAAPGAPAESFDFFIRKEDK